MKIPALILILLSLPACPLVQAAEEFTFTLADGDEIPVSHYPAPGDRLLLWLPSEFGSSPRQRATAEALARRGVEVWMPDLHAAWFLAAGRYSLNEVDPGAIEQLIGEAAKTGREIYLMAPGRSTALALRALRRYQRDRRDTQAIRGLISIGPRLFRHTPQGGEAADYLPIASASNVPMYILQPHNAGGFWRIGRLVQRLEKGGSPVFLQVLDDVRDAFNRRDDYTPGEQAATESLPDTLLHAMYQLDGYPGLPAEPAPLAGPDLPPEGNPASDLLRPYAAKGPTPALDLPRLRGGRQTLTKLTGSVVLVNFWATWCPPCVEEIPSLERLYSARHAQGLEILAVNVGEEPVQVRAFLADKAVNFPVLLDTDGGSLKRWGVHAFPTTLVLDRSHRIRYAGFGAFAWDGPEILKTLDALLAEGRQ